MPNNNGMKNLTMLGFVPQPNLQQMFPLPKEGIVKGCDSFSLGERGLLRHPPQGGRSEKAAGWVSDRVTQQS